MYQKGTVFIIVQIIVLGSILAAGLVHAEPRTVVFGGTAEYRPFHFLDSSGQPDGFDVALFGEIARKANWTPAYQLGDSSATQQELLAGEVDVVPMFISKERRDKYLADSPNKCNFLR